MARFCRRRLRNRPLARTGPRKRHCETPAVSIQPLSRLPTQTRTAITLPSAIASELITHAERSGLVFERNSHDVDANTTHAGCSSRTDGSWDRCVAPWLLFDQAETPEERADIFFTLSDDELQSGARLSNVLDGERKAVEQLVGRATLIQAEIAGTVAAILDYLVARRLLLDEFIDATHYFDDVAPEEKIAFVATVATAKEVAQVAIEFLVTKAGPKLLEQVPIVGLAVGAADLVNEMRVKRRDFRERSAQIRERTEALIGRNATSEILDLEADLALNAENPIKLRDMVGMLEEFLRQSASEHETR
jgi:hypothetical protein